MYTYIEQPQKMNKQGLLKSVLQQYTEQECWLDLPLPKTAMLETTNPRLVLIRIACLNRPIKYKDSDDLIVTASILPLQP